MISGIGIDLTEIERIRQSVERSGESFVKRILTESEMKLYREKSGSVTFLAGRFAAKEAAFKAAGTGWSRGIGWHDVEILNDIAGRPFCRLTGKIKEISGAAAIHISITHERKTAAAVVIFEKERVQ